MGPKTDIKDEYGNTALIMAAREGHEAVVRLLLTNGTTLRVMSNYRHTALSAATLNGHIRVVHLLCTSVTNFNFANLRSNTSFFTGTYRFPEAAMGNASKYPARR
jgi:ankyrin repeat protein